MLQRCMHCGTTLGESVRFCENCGAHQNGAASSSSTAQKPSVSTVGGNGNLKLCADGTYRWLYEFPTLKNPTILFTVWKILALCSFAPMLITILADLKRDGFGALVAGAKVYGLVLLIILPVTLLAYFILAAIYGWKYVVLFEMNDKGIVHLQQPKQFKKAQGVALLTMLVGKSGLGLQITTKNAQSSKFASVTSVRGLRRRNTIILHTLFSHNQVYAEQENYDFIWRYITTRCEKAKIR